MVPCQVRSRERRRCLRRPDTSLCLRSNLYPCFLRFCRQRHPNHNIGIESVLPLWGIYGFLHLFTPLCLLPLLRKNVAQRCLDASAVLGSQLLSSRCQVGYPGLANLWIPLTPICVSSGKRQQQHANGWKASRRIVCYGNDYVLDGSIWGEAKRTFASRKTRSTCQRDLLRRKRIIRSS